jgi:molybdopterin converting factor small subunit
MNYENFKTGFNKPSIFTAQQYGTKTTVEVDHSDMDLDEVMDAFQTLLIGMGYHESSFKNWVIDRANEYNETDAEELKEKLEAWKFDDESIEELENDFFGNYDSEAERRMDIIGQNGNDGLHYRATDEDEAEFDDYGMRIPEDRVGFEWGDTPEDDDNLFEGDSWFANENLKDANERYKSEVKKMNTKKKNKKK